MHSSILKKSLACFIACILVFCMTGIISANTEAAFAITEETEAELTETQRKIEDSAKAYDEAAVKLEALETQITENEGRLAELENVLPTQQEKSEDAVVALYKLDREGYSLVDTLLGSGSLTEFLATIEYINQVQQSNINEIARLSVVKEELEETRDILKESKERIEAEQAAAESALEEAQALRMEAQQRAQEEAEAEAEEAAAAAAAAAAQAEEDAANQAAAESNADDTGTPPDSNGGGSGISDVDWSDDKTTFVNEWAPRIDAYLNGSPMAGCGTIYAEAAWNYGVDPRWSPAISNTESSKGTHCFKPHNAWGWGSKSWGSWEEAIHAHVSGLARGYGYTISVEAAKKYCPPTWEHWYTSTLNQMNMI